MARKAGTETKNIEEAKKIVDTVDDTVGENEETKVKTVAKTLREKVIEILKITDSRDLDRPQGGLCKFYDLGIIQSDLVIPYRGKTIRQFELIKREKIQKCKMNLKEDLGEDYKYLSIETRLFKPKFGATGSNQKFKLGIYIYGPDFPRLIKKVGKNKNIKVIE